MGKKDYLMNIEELASYLKLKKQTIYNWLCTGKISGIKVGRVWRFSKKEIDKWLKENIKTSNGKSA